MAYDTLGFALYRTCSASCKHCCFSCTPSCTEKLDLDRVKSYIKESQSIEQINNIAFTGGEAFLSYATLVDLISEATKAGKKTSVATNGYWASDYNTTYSKLRDLKECGLKYLSVSHDLYHKEFVNTENIKNILRASIKIDLPITLAMIKLKNENIGKIIDALGSDVYPASIKIGPCLPVGAAKKNFLDMDFDRTVDSLNAKCPYGGNLSVLYNGIIYPCCSQVIINTGLSIGNFEEISLSEALEKAKNNALLYFLRNTKMLFFTDYLTQKYNISFPKKIVNPCELCNLIFKKKNVALLHNYVMNKIQEIMLHTQTN